MLKLQISIIILLIFALGCFAQKTGNEFDFSGSWILNEKKSFQRDRDDVKDYIMIVEDKGSSIKIIESYIWSDDKYYGESILNLDKSGEKNVYYKNDQKEDEIKSISHRKKRTIYRNYRERKTYKSADVEYEAEYKIEEKYILSKDGKKLIVKVNKRLMSQMPYHFGGGPIALISNSWTNYVFEKKQGSSK